MLRRLIAVATVSFALCSPVFAVSTDQASKYVEDMGNKALAIITNSKFNAAQKQSKLDLLFHDAVDTAWIGRFVMGRFWRQATPEQRTVYLREYHDFLSKNYTGRFAEYSEGSFKILGSREDGDGEFTVNMAIQNPDTKKDVLVDYRVHLDEKGRLRVFDIAVEGVSLITTQRSEFGAVLSQKGIDGLINELKEHPTALAEKATN